MGKLYTTITKSNEKDFIFTKLYSWESPERDWFPKGREWYVLYSFFFVVIIAIAAILQEYLLIMAVLAFVFLWFIQGATPPQIAEHVITTIGIRTFDKLYKWKNIKHFWFSVKGNTIFLNLDLIDIENNPEHIRTLSLIVNPNEDISIFDTLIKYVDYGDKKEISFNPLTKLVHGHYVHISTYLPEDTFEEEVFIEDTEEIPNLHKAKKKVNKSTKKDSSKLTTGR